MHADWATGRWLCLVPPGLLDPAMIACGSSAVLARALVVLTAPLGLSDAACPQVSNLVEDAQGGKPLKGPNSSNATTPLSPTTAHAIFAATVRATAQHTHILCAFNCFSRVLPQYTHMHAHAVASRCNCWMPLPKLSHHPYLPYCPSLCIVPPLGS